MKGWVIVGRLLLGLAAAPAVLAHGVSAVALVAADVVLQQ